MMVTRYKKVKSPLYLITMLSVQTALDYLLEVLSVKTLLNPVGYTLEEAQHATTGFALKTDGVKLVADPERPGYVQYLHHFYRRQVISTFTMYSLLMI